MKIHLKKSNQTEKSDAKKEHSPLYFLSYFLILVGISIGMAVVIRFFFLVQKSTFSTSSYFVLVTSKNPFIAALDKTSPKLSIVSVPAKIQKNRVKESLFLGVPIDGEILTSTQNTSKDSFPDIVFLTSMIFQPWLYSYENMTIIDAVRFTFSSLSISQKNVSHYTIKFLKTGDMEGMSPTQLYDIFKDSTIINEQVSIEIVNATSIQGLAGSVGQVLKNMGCNVVSITSVDEKDSSRIIADSHSATLTRVSHILGIHSDVESTYQGITDMKIVLGKDFGDKIK